MVQTGGLHAAVGEGSRNQSSCCSCGTAPILLLPAFSLSPSMSSLFEEWASCGIFITFCCLKKAFLYLHNDGLLLALSRSGQV